MKEMIEATIKAREKKAREDKAEDRQREQRAEKKQTAARRELKREQDEQRREQERADKEAERKRKKREKEFEAIAKLPRLAHEARLAELAKRLGEDLELLRDEFADFVGPDEMESRTRAMGRAGRDAGTPDRADGAAEALRRCARRCRDPSPCG